MIRFIQKGKHEKTKRFLKALQENKYFSILDKYGRRGVDALQRATPVDTGLTAGSWGYEIHTSKDSAYLYFVNDNIVDGIPVAILIQYGHGTRGGAYVRGRDYINPAIQPVFDELAEEAWREVTKL